MAQKSLMSKSNIKTAILQIAGQVSTSEAVRYNWKFLRCVTVKQFNIAATELETENFGTVVSVGNAKIVFIKKPPDQVQHLLEARPQLCHPDVYRERYYKPSPKSIKSKVRSSLVAMGYIAQEHWM